MGREGLQARIIGNDKAYVAFSAGKATVLRSTPFLVPIHSLPEVFFCNDRAFLFSLSTVNI